MKSDQKAGIVSTAVGAAAGVASAYLDSFPISVGAAVSGYVLVFFVCKWLDNQKKAKWILSNSMPSFFLIWILVWIISFNLFKPTG
jgi:hypothetical protein